MAFCRACGPEPVPTLRGESRSASRGQAGYSGLISSRKRSWGRTTGADSRRVKCSSPSNNIAPKVLLYPSGLHFQRASRWYLVFSVRSGVRGGSSYAHSVLELERAASSNAM
jgi:hypothetical protein